MESIEKQPSVEGSFRVFGEIGPPYQVLRIDKDVAEIVFLETSEKIKVPLTVVLNDPIKK